MAAHSEVGVHTAALTSVDCENGSISFWMRIKKCFMRREKVLCISIRAYQNRNNDDKTLFPLSFRPPLNSTLYSLLHNTQKHPVNDLSHVLEEPINFLFCFKKRNTRLTLCRTIAYYRPKDSSTIHNSLCELNTTYKQQ